ncbi:MAG TPA: ABC transporter ATP-binding protein [Opitutaceae bacterium]|nr:ABC transporter ATP-binding protein [Opitutaceae bacterium]
MAEPVITVANLGKRYQLSHAARHDTLRDTLAHRVRGWLGRRPADGSVEDFWALRDVSFEVRRGDVVGIIGRNGAGKSTLLKILSRITEPTTGRIGLRGRVASLLEVGTGFHPELSGRENIYLNGAILGMTRAEIRRKFDEIVAFAEVERFLDTPVKHYSSGMYVRLAFSVAAHLEPEILIVDEVLAVGDAAFQKKCLGKMQQVAEADGRTVLLVSHNLVSIQQLCTRAIHLQAGRLVGVGEPLEQIRQYLGTVARQAPVLDLTGAARSLHPRGQARLLNVTLEDGAPEAAWNLPFGQPLRLTFTIRVAERLPSLELGLGLFNLQGVELMSTLSSWEGNLGPVDPGTYRLSADYGVTSLAPGRYFLGVGLKGESGLEDYIPEAFELEIGPSELSRQIHLDTIRGAIAHRARFSLTPQP